ncbi:MAG: Ppx/GppA family phosphatase [Eggerthellaceae bacterium]|nr:Ppx/GppA family phosphatase [Eggerthellaceae bacterium]
MPANRIAAIDIGTVTCRLLVADVDESGLHQLYKSSAIVNLGEEVDANGYLLDSAMKRVDRQIAEYMQVIEGLTTEQTPVRVIAMATSASRDASNAADFVAMLERRGVRLSVIPGEKEASLSFLGASAAFTGERLLVCDVGGGSSELIAGVGGQEPLRKHSFNVGCRRVTERFLKSDPPAAEELQEAVDWFAPQFATFFQALAEQDFKVDRIVAVAGTATSMVSIEQAMEVYDSSRVHGAKVTLDSLNSIRDRLASLPLEQRRCVTGLQPDRAPVIVAGTLILGEIVRQAGLDGFTVSEADILHGIIMDAGA